MQRKCIYRSKNKRFSCKWQKQKDNVTLASRESFVFLICFAATDFHLTNDIAAPRESHFKEASTKRGKKQIPSPLNKNNTFAPEGGERLLTLPDTLSPTLCHYRRRLPPDTTASQPRLCCLWATPGKLRMRARKEKSGNNLDCCCM